MGNITITLSSILASEAGARKIQVEASTLKEALDSLTAGRSSLKGKLLDNTGLPREYINIYVDGRDYRFLGGFDAPLKDGSSISLIPAVSGG